jgi:serine/threonine protein kinase
MSRWEQVESLCQAALELEESRREAFLKEACAGDEELRQEVESLLQYDKRGGGFIEEPALGVAAKMITAEKPESLLGLQLGSYLIQSLLGTGGMGVVYKGRDVRLNRSVAIKVLPRDKMSDPDRKRRFIQEAKAASALNHPNIITIHDIGNESGIDFIVMEHVAGKTLDQRIPRKGMKLNEALKVAVQMADALAKAHSAGIIHRDLKPGNVMVTNDGRVKILDFGLAKLTEVENDEEGTRTTQPQTETGTIVGTVSYMSPEQAEGKKVDARSDIFSFGSVLYEMVTGQKAFQGDSKMSTVAAILNQEPKPISQVAPGIAGELEKIINRCLRKDRERRYQYMADIKITLQEVQEESDSGAVAETPAAAGTTRRAWMWAGGTLIIVAIAVVAWFFRGDSRKPQARPEVVPLTSYVGSERSPSFSPDGNQVAFSWNGEKQDNFDIYIKLIGSPTPVRLTTDPNDDVSPAFSPDGRSIGFLRVSKDHATFLVIPAIGGPERVVADLPDGAGSFSWFPDGKWIVTDGLTLLSTESDETRILTSQSFGDYSPSVSPDGHSIAFTRSAGFSVSNIYLLDLTEDLKVKREPLRLTSLKGQSSGSAWAANGKAVIFALGNSAGTEWGLWKVLTSGAEGPEKLPFDSGSAWHPAVSRSGNRLAYQREMYDGNIWRISLAAPGMARGISTRFIASTRDDSTAQYSPDGKRIAFESERNGVHSLWICDADGSNAVELFSPAHADAGSACWSPDGQSIAFTSNLRGNFSIYVIRPSGGKLIHLTKDSAAYEDTPSWSRDGKWVYFLSNRTGRDEVWRVSAGGGEAVQVTGNGGGPAFESPDGKSMYYIKGQWSGGLWKMPFNGGEETQILPSVVRRAFCLVKEGIYFIPEPGDDRKYSIQFLSFTTGKVKTVAPMLAPPTEGLSASPDGRFLLFSQADEAGSDLMLVENFR